MDRETRDMLLETADRFFTDRCGRELVNNVEKGIWPAELWQAIEEMGLPHIAVPEDKGGAGGTLADMLALLRLAGSHAVPVPLAETALANLLIAAAGSEPKGGPATVALGALSLSGGRVSGRVERVPFATVVDRYVVVVGDKLAVVGKGAAACAATPSHAGEPYGTVTFDRATAEFVGESPVNAERAVELGAVMRAMQMAGAAACSSCHSRPASLEMMASRRWDGALPTGRSVGGVLPPTMSVAKKRSRAGAGRPFPSRLIEPIQ